MHMAIYAYAFGLDLMFPKHSAGASGVLQMIDLDVINSLVAWMVKNLTEMCETLV